MGSSVKATLRWMIRLVVIHPLSSMAVVVLVGISTFFALGAVPAPFSAHAGSTNATTSAATAVMPKGNLPAPASTESFMTGQATYNGEMVWASLSNTLHDSLSTQGATKETIQEQLDQYKQAGRLMDNVTYVGGYAGAEKSYYFYVASISQPSVAQAESVFFAFTLDNQGKILMVE